MTNKELTKNYLNEFGYTDWESGNGKPELGDFILMLRDEYDGSQPQIKGVIVSNVYANYGKNIPIVLTENGEWWSLQDCFEMWDVCQISGDRELINKLVLESSFDGYPEFKILNKLTK